MKVGIQDIKKCVDKAREFTDLYKQYVLNVATRRSIDELLRICREYLAHDIELNELNTPVPHNSILGTYIKEPKRFVINIQPGQNFCWKRFIICKELFHVLLDEPDCRIHSVAEHLAEVAAVFPVLDSQPGPAVISEVLAEIAAMEFLFPYADRVARNSAAPDYPALAEEFKIPLVMVEKYMSASYMSNLSAFPA